MTEWVPAVASQQTWSGRQALGHGCQAQSWTWIQRAGERLESRRKTRLKHFSSKTNLINKETKIPKGEAVWRHLVSVRDKLKGKSLDSWSSLCKDKEPCLLLRILCPPLSKKSFPLRVRWFERIALKHVYYHMWNRWPAQAQCMKQGTQSQCTGTTQRNEMGREVGRGFGAGGDTCTPVADSCQCMVKTTTIL